MDIGRKRDLTVLWVIRAIGRRYVTAGLSVLERRPFSEQGELIDRSIRAGVRRLCIDATGVGLQLSEEAEQRWPGMVEGVTFTMATKARMAALVKDAMERNALEIPDCPEIRKDLHRVRRQVTAAGNVRFAAPRAGDHADRFWALALALLAAQEAGSMAPAGGGYSGGVDKNAARGHTGDWF